MKKFVFIIGCMLLLGLSACVTRYKTCPTYSQSSENQENVVLAKR